MTAPTSPSSALPRKSPSGLLRLWAELPGLAVLIIHALWLAAWYSLAVPSMPSSWGIVLLLAGAMLASHYLARALNAAPGSILLKRGLLLVWISSLLLFSVGVCFFRQASLTPWQLLLQTCQALLDNSRNTPLFWHLLILLLGILRSVVLGRTPVTRDHVQRALIIGVIFLLIAGFAQNDAIPAFLLPLFYGLLFSGLVGLSTAHFVDLAETSGGSLPASGGSWAVSILVGALGSVGIAALAGWLINENVAGALAQVVLAIFMVMAVALMLVLSPLLTLLLEVSNRIGQAIFASSPELLPQFSSDEAINDIRNTGQENLNILADLFERSQGVVMLIVLISVVILALALAGWQSWQRRLHTAQGESGTAARVRRANQPSLLPKRPSPLGNARRWLAAARIRNVYAQLMQLYARLNHPRPPALTPLEFVPHMAGILPECLSELETITTAYLKVRYGELPETSAEVQIVLQAWKKTQKAGRQKAASLKLKHTAQSGENNDQK